jgi:hypothetical protein
MSEPIFSLSWLVHDRVTRAERNDGQAWWLYFESGATLFVECMWRKLENGVLSFTSEDHGHKFGLPAPFDGVSALEELSKHLVSSVTIREGTADVAISFGEHNILEIIPTSGGYESWSVTHPALGTVFAIGGGLLNSYKTA